MLALPPISMKNCPLSSEGKFFEDKGCLFANLAAYLLERDLFRGKKDQDHGHRHASDELRLLYDVPQGIVYPLCHSRRCVAVPHYLLHFGGEEIYSSDR